MLSEAEVYQNRHYKWFKNDDLPLEHPRPTKRMREALAKVCVVCGSTGDLEVDHITPLAQGGKHTLENVQILCRVCHKRKHVLRR